MTQTDVRAMEQPGPVDYLVVEFPPDRQEFTGEMAEELRRLTESGTVRVLRVLIAVKNMASDVVVQDVGEGGEAAGALAMAGDIAAIMAQDDLARVTESMPPGTVVGVVVWENTWTRGFAAAARRAGGRVAANGRIPAEAMQPPEPSAEA